MPEGDTIRRLANAIRPSLIDQKLTEVTLRERGRLAAFVDSRVESVEARGKHLLIDVESGWSLRTHLGMYGDVHRYRPGERWKSARERAVLVMRTNDVELVWFEPAQADLWPTKALHTHPRLARLGQDLLGPEIDLDAVVQRASTCARLRGSTYTVAELLLDQSVACGIGNIYKNEVLFIEGVSPLTPAVEVDDATMRRLYERARQLLGRNLSRGRRATRRGLGRGGTFLRREPRLWVYGRDGNPCLRCGTIVRKIRQGPQKRATFYCERCQKR